MTVRHRGLPVLACVLLATSACGAQPVADESVPLEPGWTELPPAPYSADLRHPIVFWAEDELIVAGGFEQVAPYMYSEMLSATYSYSFETGRWDELAPFVVPGYEGVLATGGWNGSAWVGLGTPCPSGPLPDESVSDICPDEVVGLRWEPSSIWSAGGWSVSEIDVPPEPGGLEFAGVTPASEVIVTSSLGFFTYPPDAESADAWQYQRWPPGAEPNTGPTCLLGDQLLTLQDTDRYEGYGSHYPVPHPTNLSVVSLPDLDVAGRGLVVDTYSPSAYCWHGHALLVQAIYPTEMPAFVPGRAGTPEPVQLVTADSTTPLPTPTSGFEGEVWVSVQGDWIDVGSGLVSLGGTFSTYLDGTTWELTRLADGPSLDSRVWTGQVLIGNPYQAGNRWFAFVPVDGSWPDSASLAFPEPLPFR